MKTIVRIILGLFVVASLLLTIGCDGGGSDGGGYAIGDTGPSGVGIVFYVTDGGLHGLEAAPNDQSTSQVWISGGSTQSTSVPGGTGTALGTGSANTDNIIAQAIAAGNSTPTSYAAGLARAHDGGGYNDWYLPSKDELNKLYLNKTAVGGFASDYYWSSSESISDDAWDQNFDNGFPGYDATNKGSNARVRAVRAF